MDRDLVEERRWISRQDYAEGLAFSQLSPGPLAAQLAMYIGWLKAGRLGALLVSIAFISPSFLMAMAIAAAYVKFGRLPWIQGLFYGIGAAVISIIGQSAWRLARKTVGRDRFLWKLFTVVAVTTVWIGTEMVWLFVLCGVLAVLVKTPPRFTAGSMHSVAPGMAWLLAGIQGPVGLGVVAGVGWFFLKAGAFVFGSGLAIVPFLYGGVVREFHWLTERQFLDAIAVAMITPGPVVITAAFIGYLVAGIVGGTIAAAAVFAPPFAIVVVAAPYYRRFAGNPRVKAFVQGVTAAAVGAIAGAAVILARRALVDLVSVGLALVVLATLLKLKRIPEPFVIIAAGAVGLLLHRSGS
jgi:chromate transporter